MYVKNPAISILYSIGFGSKGNMYGVRRGVVWFCLGIKAGGHMKVTHGIHAVFQPVCVTWSGPWPRVTCVRSGRASVHVSLTSPVGTAASVRTASTISHEPDPGP